MTIGPIGFIGAGVMGEAVFSGLLAAGTAPEQILVTDARVARVDEVASTHGVTGVDLDTLLERSRVVVIAVKPQDIRPVLDQLATGLGDGVVVVSIAAGVTTATIEEVIGDRPVVRVMPNTPAQVGQGMSVLSGGRFATDDDLAVAEEIMSGCGQTVVVPEKHQEAATAVSGSGPAYFFHFVEALIDTGVELGLPRPVAASLATQTALGSATLMAGGEHPAILRERVTSPGGSTAAALATFDDHGVRAGIAAGMRAAVRRTRELGS